MWIKFDKLKTLRILDSARDRRLVDLLLNSDKGLICPKCQGITFEVKIISEGTLTITTGKIPILGKREDQKVSVLKVLKCVSCNNEVNNVKETSVG